MRFEYNLKRFEYGKKTNWSDPNTTDIHSVYKINNLAAYLSKYMAKVGIKVIPMRFDTGIKGQPLQIQTILT